MNLYFLSFGDSVNYGQALARCEQQAKNFKDENGEQIFKDIFCVNEQDIQNNFPEFFEQNLEFIQNNPKGYGYWIWKPYLILKLMESLDEGDVILYMDSGCQINYNAVDRLKFYYDKALEYNGLCFETDFDELMFTKMDTYLKVFPEKNGGIDTPHIMATSMLLKTTEENKKFLKEWYEIAFDQKYRYIDDSPSVEENSEKFLDHRHDQSIFSLLVKKYNYFYKLFDETYWSNESWVSESKKYPIWATRNRSNRLVLV